MSKGAEGVARETRGVAREEDGWVARLKDRNTQAMYRQEGSVVSHMEASDEAETDPLSAL